ncbi:hypothetical protein ACFQ1M_13240 [Sungkyunkwania multivorans]|uniref:Uncharacterized protein n=1 Tax=Sungkyunkwania multivorans TaxID=1173618 RepID=A0ABW3CZC0_9FLAO
MNSFEHVENKLERFIKKYYANQLIRGAILFFAIGLLYFIITLFIEYFLWLEPLARTVLFWCFVLIELTLFVRFVAIPLAHLFKLKKGIDKKMASSMIGAHFPEVNDKLLNVLQLSDSRKQSELLVASIDQKSAELTPIPFNIAINFKKNLTYLKYAFLPLLIILLVYFSGNINWFTDSYERIVNHTTAYEPPAPFRFFVVSDELRAIENTPFYVEVKVVGEALPQNAQIIVDGQRHFLKNSGSGSFSYVFERPKEDMVFSLFANGVNSKDYTIEVVKIPSLVSFEMLLDYPSYTGKKDEVYNSTGNALIPEGTRVTWNLIGQETTGIDMFMGDSIYSFKAEENGFSYSQRIFNSSEYELATSNNELKHYERLGFSLDVVKDQYPQIEVKEAKDSMLVEEKMFYGQVSDDYAVDKLVLVYYPTMNEEKKVSIALDIEKQAIDQFVYAFPNGLEIDEGMSYSLYFEVIDNDVFRKGKKTKSQTFTYRKLTTEEKENELLEQQKETIDSFDDTLKKLKDQKTQLKEISKTQKERNNLNFNDRKQLENFLKRQGEQESMMKKFTEELKENLEQFQKEETKEDEYKKLLKERLERQQKELEKNEELMKELEKLADKMNKDELSQKLEELAKQQQNNERSLEQVLELTKRYYVAQKAEKMQQELAKLAEKQDELSKKEGKENTKEKQDALNQEFKDLQKQMEELKKDNEDLKRPMKIDIDKKSEQEVEKNQREASEELEKIEKEEKNENTSEQEKQESLEQQQNAQKQARTNQKRAAQKLKKMSQQMKQGLPSGGGGDSPQEDAEALRQILDNLVLFSFDQEALLEQFRQMDNSSSGFASKLKKQFELRDLFEHVDDSLFSLSLRQPKISEQVNENITNVYFNIDKSLERLAENQIFQGVGNQQYALTSANELASFLSDVLDNMEASMGSGQGSGSKSRGFQLPDIIQSQDQLNEQMKKGMKQGKDGKPQSSGQGKEGKKDGGEKEGKNGQKGEGDSKGGQEGKNRNDGQGNAESDSEMLFEIYKQQQQLRQALEKQLEDRDGEKVLGKDGQRLVKEMEQIENKLLEQGLTNQVLQQMIQLKHQLLKLENAAFEQGQKEERESETNTKSFTLPQVPQSPSELQYFNQIEILNRQVLPLRQIYKRKVQSYFKDND